MVLFERGSLGLLVVGEGWYCVLRRVCLNREDRRGCRRSIESVVVSGGWQDVKLEEDAMIVVSAID